MQKAHATQYTGNPHERFGEDRRSRNFVAFLCAAALPLFCFGEWQNLDGASDPSTWPTSGDVKVVWKTGNHGANSVYVGDEQAEIVEGWDNVLLSTTAARLIFTNKTKVINFKANVTGDGCLWAIDSAGLILSGDNSGRTGKASGGKNYVWLFENTPVVAAHEYALGPSDASYAKFKFTKTAAPAPGRLTFKWGGDDLKVYTNHCPIIYETVDKYYGYNADFPSDSEQMRFGPAEPDEKYVQAGSFMLSQHGTNKRLYLRGNVEFTTGVFGTCNDDGNAVYRGGMMYVIGTASQSDDTTPHKIVVSGDTYMRIGEISGNLRTDGFLYSGSDLYLGHTGGTRMTTFSLSTGNVFVDSDGLFMDPEVSGNSIVLSMYAQNQTSYENCFNLQGHDVNLAHLHHGNVAPTESSANYAYITSTLPATVTLSVDLHGADIPQPAAIEIVDNVSLTVENNATNRISTRVSNTKGTLTVGRGTLEFLWNGGWAGTNVVIGAEGRLVLDASSRGLTSEATVLSVANGGKFSIESGTTTVHNAYYAGEQLKKGVYGAAGSANPLPWLEGGGSLCVAKGPKVGFTLIFR